MYSAMLQVALDPPDIYIYILFLFIFFFFLGGGGGRTRKLVLIPSIAKQSEKPF